MTPLTIGLVAGAIILLAWLLGGSQSHVIYNGSAGLLYRNGVFQRLLEPGRHRIFSPGSRTQVFLVPTHEVALAPKVLSLVSRDQFAFRITLAAGVRVTDPRAYREAIGFEDASVPGTAQMLARFAPAALRTDGLDAALASEVLAAAARRSLEEFLANPLEILDGLDDRLADVFPGLKVERLLVTEITVPPEVRKMFTEVERARREGLAQLERARAEQASLRALANAARSLSDNPQLAELRMLQLMESAKGNKTFVLGSERVVSAGRTPAA